MKSVNEYDGKLKTLKVINLQLTSYKQAHVKHIIMEQFGKFVNKSKQANEYR